MEGGKVLLACTYACSGSQSLGKSKIGKIERRVDTPTRGNIGGRKWCTSTNQSTPLDGRGDVMTQHTCLSPCPRQHRTWKSDRELLRLARPRHRANRICNTTPCSTLGDSSCSVGLVLRG